MGEHVVAIGVVAFFLGSVFELYASFLGGGIAEGERFLCQIDLGI